jgi:hypothetical protein
MSNSKPLLKIVESPSPPVINVVYYVDFNKKMLVAKMHLKQPERRR